MKNTLGKAEQDTRPKAGGEPASERRRCVMVVDDDASIRWMLYATLGKKYEIVGFDSGIELLEYLGASKPDLIVLDVCMPDIDGFSVCRTIRAQRGLRDIPVLFLTGLKKDSEFCKGIEAGADDYITKPFEMKDLEDRIESLLED